MQKHTKQHFPEKINGLWAGGSVPVSYGNAVVGITLSMTLGLIVACNTTSDCSSTGGGSVDETKCKHAESCNSCGVDIGAQVRYCRYNWCPAFPFLVLCYRNSKLNPSFLLILRTYRYGLNIGDEILTFYKIVLRQIYFVLEIAFRFT